MPQNFISINITKIVLMLSLTLKSPTNIYVLSATKSFIVIKLVQMVNHPEPEILLVF